MAVGSGLPSEGTAAQASGSTDAGAGDRAPQNTGTRESALSWRRTSAWPWPAVAVAAAGLAGYLFGAVAALLVAGQTVATLLFVAGDNPPDRRRRSWLTVSAVAAGMFVVAALFWQASSIGLLRHVGPSRTSGPTDLAGRTVTESMLKGVDLRGATLSGANFDGLSLVRFSLAGSIAPGASFIGSDLRGVSLRGADLRGANFTMACLRDSHLDGAELTGANITGADITGIKLPAKVRRTLFGKAARGGVHIRSCS